MARSASAATDPAEILVKHLKSPGSHRRWLHGRHGSPSTSAAALMKRALR